MFPPWRRFHQSRELSLRHRRGVRHYFGERLHRRIFFWFGATILLTSGMVAMVMHLLGSSWRNEIQKAQKFAASQFESRWQNPVERRALAQNIASTFSVRVTLRDKQGHVIEHAGELCATSKQAIALWRAQDELGTLTICSARERSSALARGGLVAFVGVLMIWIGSGTIARRLTKQLSELVRVAKEIGAGNLSSRVQIRCHQGDEVGDLAHVVNDMADRIEKQVCDQRELLAAVSHEMRTPLARMRILTEMSRDAITDSAADYPSSQDKFISSHLEHLEQLDQEIMEMDSLVSELLASSRLEFQALHLTEFDAIAFAKRAIERHQIPENRLHCTLSNLMIRADATLLARAIANLFDNAIKHAGGVVALRIEERSVEGNPHVVFAVEDDGPGFVDGEQHRVFDKFFQSEEGRQKGSLGLGLSLVKRIAQAHQGDAYAENRTPHGASLALYFPKNVT